MKQPSRKNRRLLTSAVARILETAGVVLLIALFIALALLAKNRTARDAANTTPEPTETPMLLSEDALFAALDRAGFSTEEKRLLPGDGTEWEYALETDLFGVRSLTVIAPLHTDLKDDGTAFSRAFNEQNETIREQLRTLLREICPLYGGTDEDAAAIVTACDKAQKKMKASSYTLPGAEIGIESEKNRVSIAFSRTFGED
ncbi:MAG: hypothetical protein IJP98_02865 [Clostridia bacterium]|nr:hypothetical protein [Clostridia bacterium]